MKREHVWILQERVEGPSCGCGQHSCPGAARLVDVFATAREAKAREKDLRTEYRALGKRFQFIRTWTAL